MSNHEELMEIGRNAYDAIAEMVEALTNDEDDARDAIEDDPLSVLVRSGWHVPWHLGNPGEYELLLTTGGPAVRIRGELDEYAAPMTARLEVQDWFTPWTLYSDADEEVLLDYARVFYYGE